MQHFNIAVVGSTGMVGGMFLKVLEERNLGADEYFLFASAKSAGKSVGFMGKPHTVIELNEENVRSRKIDIALFSAGASVSEKFAPIFAEIGAVVIDNSSYWRMKPDIPLVVPEVNGADALKHNGIIANPNCSTAQAVVALKPLYDAFGIQRVVYSTYQAVSGAGVAGYQDLENGIKGEAPKKFPHPIFNNILPQIDVFLPDGYTKEELKMIEETKKILGDDTIKVTATTVRVPVFNAHSESINVEFKKPCTLDEINRVLSAQEGIIMMDDPKNALYPMPSNVSGKDEVFVGRVRLDDTVESGCNLWVVADNIRKGAATNAVQIAEYLIKNC